MEIAIRYPNCKVCYFILFLLTLKITKQKTRCEILTQLVISKGNFLTFFVTRNSLTPYFIFHNLFRESIDSKMEIRSGCYSIFEHFFLMLNFYKDKKAEEV